MADKNGKAFADFEEMPPERQMLYLYMEIIALRSYVRRMNWYTVIGIIVFALNLIRMLAK